MAGGVNQVGDVAVQGVQPQSFDAGVEKASNPQRINRSSIETVKGAKRTVIPSPGEAKEFPPLSSRKVSHLSPGKFRLLLSRPKKEVSFQDLGGVKQQNKTLSSMFERQEPAKARNKAQAQQQVRDCEDGVKWAKSNHKNAAKLADSATLKLSVADKTGVPAKLTPVEREALQQLEQAKELVGKFEGKLHGARTVKDEFKTVEKLKDSFSSRLGKLEKKLSEASSAVNARFTPSSVSDHKSRVSDLGKKLASVETALKDLNKLTKEVAVAEERHSGATPKEFRAKVQKFHAQAETIRKKGPEVLRQAKSKRDQVLAQQAETRRAAKQAAREEKEINREFKKLGRLDRQQDRRIQQAHADAGKKTQKRSTSEVQAQARKASPKQRASVNDQPSRVSAKQKPVSRPSASKSRLSGKASWTPEDQALENRLKRLKGQVAHDPVTASGKAKTYGQLEKQAHNISSVDDLKALVADRRSSRITVSQQRKYLGLLSAAVMGMAKNPAHAKQMNGDLIRDVLREQPDEARAAIELLDKTKTASLQRSRDQLRAKK